EVADPVDSKIPRELGGRSLRPHRRGCRRCASHPGGGKKKIRTGAATGGGMKGLPMGLELNAAMVGILPEDGGLYDQDARFVDAIREVFSGQAEAIKRIRSRA